MRVRPYTISHPNTDSQMREILVSWSQTLSLPPSQHVWRAYLSISTRPCVYPCVHAVTIRFVRVFVMSEFSVLVSCAGMWCASGLRMWADARRRCSHPQVPTMTEFRATLSSLGSFAERSKHSTFPQASQPSGLAKSCNAANHFGKAASELTAQQDTSAFPWFQVGCPCLLKESPHDTRTVRGPGLRPSSVQTHPAELFKRPPGTGLLPPPFG